MNALDKVTLNSVNLIDERLKLLQKELEEIEKEYGPLKTEKPVVSVKSANRYQELPSLIPEPVKVLTVKPQIKEEYLRTLQFVPDIMSEYHSVVQEPQYLNEAKDLVTPPRPILDNFLMYAYLEKKNREIE